MADSLKPRRRSAVCLVAVALALAGLAASPRAQQPQQPFRAGVRLVPVYVSATDGAGQFVLDLKREEFEVKDDGKPQPIVQFTTEAQPLSVVLMLDGSGSMLQSFDTVIEGADHFIIRLMPGDRAAIGSFADRVVLNQRLTPDRDALLDYLHNEFNLRMGNETRLWDAVDRAVLSLRQAANRRVVVVFSDGYDTTSTLTARFVAGEAQAADVMVFAVATWTTDGHQGLRPNGSLEELATDTGGGYFELRPGGDMNAPFTRIAEELHNQYILGFTPAVLDGKTHKLEVHVTRPGVQVRARKNYVASPDRQPS